jgi:DnaJ domain
MPTLLIAVLAVALTLWLIKSFTRSDPRYLVMILTTIGRTVGGILAVAAAAFLLFRGELLISVPLGLFGLSLLGWQPGRELLTSYFDRRYPRWGEHGGGDAATGQRREPVPTGKMTEQEAHQILGLYPGASAEDVTRAHRALIKKLHPDQGGSTYLAARVNEAKDVLLRRHQ